MLLIRRKFDCDGIPSLVEQTLKQLTAQEAQEKFEVKLNFAWIDQLSNFKFESDVSKMVQAAEREVVAKRTQIGSTSAFIEVVEHTNGLALTIDNTAEKVNQIQLVFDI